MPALDDVIVLRGRELEPRRVRRFAWEGREVATLDDAGPVPPGSPADCGLVVIPGLTNGHTHWGDHAFPDATTRLTLEEGFFRPHGFKYRELAKLDEEQLVTRLTATLAEAASTGIVRHLDFREQGPRGSRALRQASKATGVDAIILGQFAGVPFDDVQLATNEAPLSASDHDELEALLAVADGFSESTMNDLTDPAWQVIRAATTRRGKLRAIHCVENEGYRNRSLAITGRGDVPRALDVYDPDLIVHMTVATAEEIAQVAAAGKTVAINPRANAMLGLPLPPVRELLESGVNLLLGTDNGMLNHPSLWPELDFTWKLLRSQWATSRDPEPRCILKMVTSNVAGLPGCEHYGMLQPGAPADFVVLDLRAPALSRSYDLAATILARISNREVMATYRNGRALYTRNDFTTS